MQVFRTNHFLIVLIFLISLFTITPFIENPVLSRLFATINYTLLLLSGLYAFSDVRNFLKFTTIFFLIAIVVEWIEFFHPEGQMVNTIGPLITASVLSLLLILTLRSIFIAREITKNVIFGALCGYILVGYIGTFLNMAVSITYPGSYNIAGELNTMEALYYSFVTMTTLGYGEILPVTDQARAITILLSILGPMYVAILIAMLVGKYASQPDK
jgi:voltage-gated potassium channel